MIFQLWVHWWYLPICSDFWSWKEHFVCIVLSRKEHFVSFYQVHHRAQLISFCLQSFILFYKAKCAYDTHTGLEFLDCDYSALIYSWTHQLHILDHLCSSGKPWKFVLFIEHLLNRPVGWNSDITLNFSSKSSMLMNHCECLEQWCQWLLSMSLKLFMWSTQKKATDNDGCTRMPQYTNILTHRTHTCKMDNFENLFADSLPPLL